MREKEIFPFSTIPIIAGCILGIASIYIVFIQTSEYVLIAWDGIFGDLLPYYFTLTAVFTIGNTWYVMTWGKAQYSTNRNILYNIAGLLLSIIAIISWYVA